MSIEIDVLVETYSILKQYIPVKDRQEAVDNLMSVLVDMLNDEELEIFGSTDSTTKKAYKEYGIADEEDDDIDPGYED
jgi:1,2-phenylacetyl-CoA epoxidase catalytic subunit